MIVPGSNLLKIALGAIKPQKVGYRAFVSRTTSPKGTWVNTYNPAPSAPPQYLYGSFQPVSRERLQLMGLDTSKSHATFYAGGQYRPVERDSGADRFEYGGRDYDAVGKVPWANQDGWEAVLLVDVGPTHV